MASHIAFEWYSGCEPCQHDRVVLDRRQTFVVQVLVGDDVVLEALRLQPLGQVRVGVELPERGLAAADPFQHLRAEVQDRAEPRGVADAAAVDVTVVERGTVFPVLAALHVLLVQHHEPAGKNLRRTHVGGHVGVGVGHVARGGQQEADLRGRRAARRTHGKGDVFLTATLAPEPRGIDAALQPLRAGEGEIDLPARVVDVVLVEVDRAVLLRRVLPVHLAAVPAPAGDGAGRQVDQAAVQSVGGEIGRPRRLDALGEVPGADDGGGERAVRRADLGKLHLRRGQHAIGDARAVDAPVVEAAADGAPLVDTPEVGAHGQRRVVLARTAQLGLLLQDAGVVHLGVVVERLLHQSDLLGLGVVGRGDEVPLVRDQRTVGGGHLDVALAVAEAERKRAVLLGDDEGRARLVAVAPVGDQRLGAAIGRRRPDEGLEGKALQPLDRGMSRHFHEGAVVADLPAPLVGAARAGPDHLLLDAGAVGVLVAADEADDVALVGGGFGTHHEVDGLSRRHADAVGITRDSGHVRLPHRRTAACRLS